MDKNLKIVILDGYTENPGDLSWDGIREFGEVIVYDRSLESEVKDRIKDADIVISNKARVNKDAIENAKNLKGIFMLATGFDPVDYNYAKEKGIGVYNVPTYGTNNVAELTFALILELSKNVGIHSDSVKNGMWERNPDFCYFLKPQIELFGKTLGIIGFGRIGKMVGEMARAFGMKVIALDRTREKAGQTREGIMYMELDDLIKNSDFITLHCPATSENKGMVNLEFLKKMKKSAYLINTARGVLVNEEDLRYALDNEIIAGAAVDVISKEPMEATNKLRDAKNIIITPHIAWGTNEARVRIMDTTYENIKALVEGNEINRVN